ncbi:MAG: FAD-binding oxidoreductase [Acidobacteriota bacterium]
MIDSHDSRPDSSEAPSPGASFDVVIIGGGVIGSSIAYFLAQESSFDGSVAVIEKDSSYVDSSTARSVGGIRQQFSIAENIAMSQFGARFFRSAAELLAVGDERPDLSFREAGYLFLATAAGRSILEQNHALQRAHGAAVALLSVAALAERFPWLNTEDLAGAALGTADEGWLDPYSLLMAFKRKAEHLGVRYLAEEVVAIELRDRAVAAVRLGDGRRVSCGHLVNAAGPRAAAVAEMAGIEDCPVRSKKRLVFTFDCAESLRNCPLVVDPSGVYFRPEGDRFLCGVSPPESSDPDCTDFKIDPHFFEDVLWPRLAHRVPAFDRLRQGTAWAGHYAVNTVDRNAIVGPHPEVEGFWFANGFSGHGLQHAPAIGRAVSELITFQEPRTLDLSRFDFARFAEGRPVTERNVI